MPLLNNTESGRGVHRHKQQQEFSGRAEVQSQWICFEGSCVRDSISVAQACCSISDTANTLAALQKLMGDVLPQWERILCKALIPVTVLLSILGIAFTITALLQYRE